MKNAGMAGLQGSAGKGVGLPGDANVAVTPAVGPTKTLGCSRGLWLPWLPARRLAVKVLVVGSTKTTGCLSVWQRSVGQNFSGVWALTKTMVCLRVWHGSVGQKLGRV